MTDSEIQSAIKFVAGHEDDAGVPLQAVRSGNTVVVSIAWSNGEESGVTDYTCETMAQVSEALGY